MSDEGIFSQIREELTKAVIEQDAPPVIDDQVVFPMVSKNDIAGLDGQELLAKQHHLGVCLRSLIGKKVIGMRFASNDDPNLSSIGWVVILEEEESVIVPPNFSLN